MFELDARLERDSLPLGDTGQIVLRYMNDARYPWVLLVPKVPGASEWFDLDTVLQQEVAALASRVGQHLKRLTRATKINIATLGNVVPQLHVHLVARHEQDDTWPGPVWGQGQARPYDTEPAWVPLLRQHLSCRCA